MAAPAVIYRPDRGRVAEEEELVYPTKMRTPPQQDYKVPQGNKIPRRLRTIHFPVAQGAGAGSTAGVDIAVVPENAIWLPIGGFGQYIASGTVGTRFEFVRFRDGFGQVYQQYGDATGLTAGQAASIEFHPFAQFSNTFPFNTNRGLIIPLPRLMTSKSTVNVFSTVAIDAADTIQMDLRVEEMTIPKGLAIEEIPMGLESGYQWDLSEVRQVA